MDCSELGMLIRENRLKQNLTQKELAQKMNVSDKAVSKWERGECFPDINLFEQLSKTLGIPINKLMLQKDDEKLNKDRRRNNKRKILSLITWMLIGALLAVIYFMLPIEIYISRSVRFVVISIYLVGFIMIGGRNEKIT